MNKHLKNRIYTVVLYIIAISFTIPATAQVVPSDLMENCKQWKITYPTGVEDKTLCDEPNTEYFYVNDTENAIVFFAPIRSNNGTTPNSSYIRSELRERLPDGSADIYWTTDGSHMIYVKQAITHLPINKPELVATQIHGNKDAGIDDSMVMRLEDSHLFLSFNGGKLRSDVTIKTNYTLGTKHEVIFLVVDGKHYCYYAEDSNLLSAYNAGNADSYLIKADGNDYVMDLNYDETYFKVGNYTQSNVDKEGSDTDNPNNYGEVLVYDFLVRHDDVSVSGVTLSPPTMDVLTGNTYQLSASVKPVSATNIGVSYSSSNSAVASVDSNGLVTAISAGSTTITVTTDEGGFTDTSEIKVANTATTPNLALNKQITATGTPDGDNIAANLVDGFTSTRWSVSGFPQTATIDLGQIYTFTRTELAAYTDRDYQYTVSVSTTGSGTYTQIVDRSGNTSPATELNPNIDIFPEIEGQFVKITVTGAATYTGDWISLLEFRVFGAVTNEFDGDGDGVLNDYDNCPNTVVGATVDANGCEILASNNFNIKVTGETCPDSNNGQLAITANKNQDYRVTINNENYSFNTKKTISNLAPGIYDICIEIVGITSPYCYAVEVPEATKISGKSSLKNNQLHMEVSAGTLPYKVFVNGDLQFETYQNDFDFEVNHGDIIAIKSKNECEGVYAKEIQLFENITVYPNPSQGLFSIPIVTNNKKVTISVFNNISQLVLSKTYDVINSRVQLDLTNQNDGIYFVKIQLDKAYQFKIAKQ